MALGSVVNFPDGVRISGKRVWRISNVNTYGTLAVINATIPDKTDTHHGANLGDILKNTQIEQQMYCLLRYANAIDKLIRVLKVKQSI